MFKFSSLGSSLVGVLYVLVFGIGTEFSIIIAFFALFFFDDFRTWHQYILWPPVRVLAGYVQYNSRVIVRGVGRSKEKGTKLGSQKEGHKRGGFHGCLVFFISPWRLQPTGEEFCPTK